jgi:hypothetical protein
MSHLFALDCMVQITSPMEHLHRAPQPLRSARGRCTRQRARLSPTLCPGPWSCLRSLALCRIMLRPLAIPSLQVLASMMLLLQGLPEVHSTWVS